MNTLWRGMAVVMALLAGPASARSLVAEAPSRPPQVWLDPALQLQPIQLRDVAIDIRIQGFIASTRLDFTFHNPNARVLEGEFVFPLAEGQSITGYALEVGGTLREGVVVEKETARVAYESTVRRGIDPGLAELTQGNVFRTRLYPLPANGTKRVQVTFDQPLVDAGKDYRYVLPLQFTQAVKHFKVHAEALRTETAPANVGTGALSFERWQGGFAADLERTDFLPERELAFSLPKPAAAATLFTIPDRDDAQWLRFAAQVQSAPASDPRPPAAPRRVALYYDASGSAVQRERARELDFLDAWAASLREVEIDLIAFRNDADAPQRFAIRNGDLHALRRAIEALPLDGASAYGALQVDPAANYDLVLVVGDGLSNFGSGEPQFRGNGTTRLAFVHAAQRADHARLTRWARRDGGQVINLLALDNAGALRQLAQTRWALHSTRVLRGQCADLAPSAPQPAGRVFSLYGRCSADAELQLDFGDGVGATLQRRLVPATGVALTGDRGEFVDRLWATARIADLENAETRDRKAIVELSRKYGVVTQDTSLLVLDSVYDYVRYKVEPRDPELAQRYRELLAGQPAPVSPRADRDAHRRQVQVLWNKFCNWHESKPHAWLDKLLPPAVDLEVVRWDALPALKDRKQHLAQARALDQQTAALMKRRAAASADPARLADWEREATAIMLTLDTLRQQRLAQAPDSDAITRKPPKIAEDDGDQRRGTSRPRPTRTMADPPPETRASEPATIVVEESSPMAMAAPPSAASTQARADADFFAQPVGGLSPQEAATIDGGKDSPALDVGITLREWDPNTPYLAKLRAAPDAYAAYLQERREQAATPAFFLDCANYFRNEAKDDRLALRVLSNLAEIDFDSAPLLRVLAYRLQQWQRFDLAVPLFEQALKLRGEEPQSRRDLALALSRREQPDYARAVTLLWEVADRRWDARFPEIEVIALHELGDVIARAPAAQQPALTALARSLGMSDNLLEPLAVDLRVVLGWDTDNTDIDLWVIDPLGEIVIFSNPRTKSGGYLSRDFTGGYGPEVFTIRRPIPGTYVVKTHYYANHAQTLTGPATLQLEFLTRFGSGQSKREAVTRRLDDAKGEIEIGRFTVGVE